MGVVSPHGCDRVCDLTPTTPAPPCPCPRPRIHHHLRWFSQGQFSLLLLVLVALLSSAGELISRFPHSSRIWRQKCQKLKLFPQLMCRVSRMPPLCEARLNKFTVQSLNFAVQMLIFLQKSSIGFIGIKKSRPRHCRKLKFQLSRWEKTRRFNSTLYIMSDGQYFGRMSYFMRFYTSFL